MEKLLITNEHLMDVVAHGSESFPIQYFVDELYRYPNQLIPLHWHADLEFYVAYGNDVSIQIGQNKLLLKEGSGIFINTNALHSFSQVRSDHRCQCPNIVFSHELFAATKSKIYQKNVQPILINEQLPYIIFTPDIFWHEEVLSLLDKTFSLLQKYGTTPDFYGKLPILPFKNKEIESNCFEMEVQRCLNRIWQTIYSHLQDIEKISVKPSSQKWQVRTQVMMQFIHDNYQKPLSLSKIAGAAHVGKSEANRCFNSYLHTSPITYLLNYRLKKAKELLMTSDYTISEISENCGFQSPSYFSKIFRRDTGLSATKFRELSKMNLDDNSSQY